MSSGWFLESLFKFAKNNMSSVMYYSVTLVAHFISDLTKRYHASVGANSQVQCSYYIFFCYSVKLNDLELLCFH